MYHTRKNPATVSRAYLYNAIAKMEGHTFYYFTARGVDFERKIIKGKHYVNGRWQSSEFPFPDVIMNVAYPRSEKQLEIYNRLLKKIPFTSYSVGNKMNVYEKIRKGRTFADYLIPYKVIETAEDVLKYLDKYKKVIVKPVKGKHGNNVYFIESMYQYYLIIDEKKTVNGRKSALIDLINELIGEDKYLVQKYIECKRKSGESYDIRLLLHKDGKGEWEVDIYPKLGTKDKIITNVSKGGQVTILRNFLKNEFGDSYKDMENYLVVFALQFAKHFESLYNHDFSELGIDIGLDENKKIWIYEVNWHPGQIFIESRWARNAVLYALYVGNKAKRKKGDRR